jgi:sulfite reductase (NADPH) flavoprotein alpha-component
MPLDATEAECQRLRESYKSAREGKFLASRRAWTKKRLCPSFAHRHRHVRFRSGASTYARRGFCYAAGARLKNRLLFKAHWLVGITVGVLLAVMGTTGALMAFQFPILDAINADARTVNVSGERLPVPVLLERATQEAEKSGARVRFFTLPERQDAAARVVFVSDASETVRYIDPYTGVWREGGARGEAFFELLEEIHRGFITDRIAGYEVGRRILDVCAVFLIALVATGLYLRWPRRTTNWRAWFVIDRRLRGRGFLYSLHAVIGTYVLPLLLVSGLTGLYFAYDWYYDMMHRIAGVPVAEEPKLGPFVEPNVAVAWSVFERETASRPVGRIEIRMPREEGEVLRIRYLDIDAPHQSANNTIKIDPATSQLLSHERYAEQSAGGRLMTSMLAIHRGHYFGIPGMTLLMLSSLALPLFVVTGWMMYLDRRRVEERARKRQAAASVAA